LNTKKPSVHFATFTAILAIGGALSGCVTSEQQISAAPTRPRPTVVAVQPPPPPPPAVIVRPAPPQTAYVAAPSDIYIAGVLDRDVVFVGGNTYLWVVGTDKKRHRQFYAHGDRRAEVFRRREHLRAEMAHRHEEHRPHPKYAKQTQPHHPQPARVAAQKPQHDRKHPQRVDEAQQQQPHPQGHHAGA